MYPKPDAYLQSFGKGEWDIAIGPRVLAPPTRRIPRRTFGPPVSSTSLNLIETLVNKIKQCRRVRPAASYLAFIKLASIRIWLRANECTSHSEAPRGPVDVMTVIVMVRIHDVMIDILNAWHWLMSRRCASWI
jgi:hypothetical protein